MSSQQEQIKEAADVLFDEGYVHELRALGVPEDWADGDGFTHSGYFDDRRALANAAHQLDNKGAKGVYVTPNPVEPDLLARAKNRTVRRPKSTTTNGEITRRRWLLIDADPLRLAGIPSTDDELAAARSHVARVARFLKSKGFPGGVLAESGNGAHLLYRVDLPPGDGGLCKRVLQTLDARFTDEEVEVDDAVHNAARIWKLYGTTARKGDATEERPHRRAKLLRVADPLEVVPRRKLEAVAAEEEPKARAGPARNGTPASGNSGPLGDLATEEVRKALDCIPPRPDYNDGWFQITAAVYDAVGGDVDAAERLLKEWSPEEERGEYRKILESDLDGSITAGTLVHKAKRNGYTPPPSRRNGHAPPEGDTQDGSSGAAPEGWPEPVPLEGGAHAPSPPMPLEALPDWTRRFAKTISDFLQCPPGLPFGLVLSALAGAVQKKAVVKVKDGYTEPLTLWTAAVLPSGERKSPAFDKVTAPFKDHERAERERIAPERQRAKDKREILEKRLQEAKKRAVKAAAGEDQEQAEQDVHAAREALDDHVVPTEPQLWTDDTTPEKLGSVMQANSGRMAALSAEGDLFKYMGSRYSGGGAGPSLNIYKAAWTGGEAFRDDRIGREGTDMPDPALSVGICVQPPVLERLADKETFRGEGVLARFLFAMPRPMVGQRKTGPDVPELDNSAVHDWERGLKRLLQLEPKMAEDGEWTPHIIELSEAARRVRWGFEERVEEQVGPDGRLRHLRDWAGKIVGQAVRIAGLLHVAEGAFNASAFEGRVSEDEMRRAVTIAEAYTEHALRAFALIETDERRRLARYVWKRIRAREPKTRRDLWQAVKGKAALAKAEDLDEPLSMLEEHGLIRVRQRESTGGRPPSPLIEVTPRTEDLEGTPYSQYSQKSQKSAVPPPSGTFENIENVPPPVENGNGAGEPAEGIEEGGEAIHTFTGARVTVEKVRSQAVQITDGDGQKMTVGPNDLEPAPTEEDATANDVPF